jgi:hypothetical protein
LASTSAPGLGALDAPPERAIHNWLVGAQVGEVAEVKLAEHHARGQQRVHAVVERSIPFSARKARMARTGFRSARIWNACATTGASFGSGTRRPSSPRR